LSPKKTPSQLVGKTTSEEVLNLVKEALEAYQNVTPIRDNLRKFTTNIGAFDSWLAMLPEAFPYASTVYGGIKILLKAATKMGEVREKVFEVVGLIPAMVAKTYKYTELYASSSQLQIQSEELYGEILGVCDHVLDWLNKPPASGFTHICIIIIRNSN